MADAPYETEREACAGARAVIPPGPGEVILSQTKRSELLHQVLADAGVETSAFEDRTLWWLANWEDHVCAIIARWVTRAAQAANEVRTCRHCGTPIKRCPDAHAASADYPLCKGWRHVGYDDQPVIGHCCEGRSINPPAEPREDGEDG